MKQIILFFTDFLFQAGYFHLRRPKGREAFGGEDDEKAVVGLAFRGRRKLISACCLGGMTSSLRSRRFAGRACAGWA
jgi:hypothetical protein